MTASPNFRAEGSASSVRDGAPAPAWDRRYTVALAGLMLCLVAFFGPHLFTSRVLYLRDVSFLHYPHAVELRDIVRSGHVPLWNPFQHFGEPVASNPDYSLFYPPAWLAWILPAAYGFKLYYVLHFFAFAAGAFLLARRCRATPFGSFAAGALGVFSGPFLSLGNLYVHLASAAWMPFGLIAADRLGAALAPAQGPERNSGWLYHSLPLGACLAIQVYAGSPDFVLITAGLATAWVLTFHARLREPALTGRNRALLIRLAAAAALAIGLSALQAVPALWHLRHSERAGALSSGMFWSAHPLHLVSLLLPDFFGAPLPGGATPWLLLDGREPFLYSTFIGLIAVAFAACALLVQGPHQRLARWWAVIGGVCIVIALGKYTPAGALFDDSLFRVLRYPAKWLVPSALAITQLAAMGIDRLLAHAQPARAKLVIAGRVLIALAVVWTAAVAVCAIAPAFAARVGAAFAWLFFNHALVLEIGGFRDRTALLAAAGQWLPHALRAQLAYLCGVAILFSLMANRRVADRTRRRVVIATAALAIAHAAFVNYELNAPADARMFSDAPPVAAFIPRSALAPRVYVEKAGAIAVDIAQTAFLPQAAAAPYAYRMNLEIGSVLSGIETPWSADIERVLPREQDMLLDMPRRRWLSATGLTRLLQLSGTGYAVFTRGAAPPELSLLGVARNGPGGEARVYRVPGGDAHAWLVPDNGAHLESTGAATIARLTDPAFDPRAQVLLDPQSGQPDFPGSGFKLPFGSVLRAQPQTDNWLETVAWRATRIEFHGVAREPSYLVVAAAYDPDWHAYVDGAAVPVFRANQMFRAVPLAAGMHDVVFVYRPAALYVGAGVTLIVVLFIVSAWYMRRREDAMQTDATDVVR